MGGTEHKDPARLDGYLLASLGIAADTLALEADEEAAEGRDLDCLASLQGLGHLVQDRLHQLGRFIAREADFLIDRLGEMGAGDRAVGHWGWFPGVQKRL